MAVQYGIRPVAAEVETSAMRELVVTDLGDGLESLAMAGRTVGFIQRAGHVFVALTGTRTDRAVECGQFLVWDEAARTLLAAPHRATHVLAA